MRVLRGTRSVSDQGVVTPSCEAQLDRSFHRLAQARVLDRGGDRVGTRLVDGTRLHGLGRPVLGTGLGQRSRCEAETRNVELGGDLRRALTELECPD